MYTERPRSTPKILPGSPPIPNPSTPLIDPSAAHAPQTGHMIATTHIRMGLVNNVGKPTLPAWVSPSGSHRHGPGSPVLSPKVRRLPHGSTGAMGRGARPAQTQVRDLRTSTGTGRSIPHWEPQAFCLPTGAREATTDPVVGNQARPRASPTSFDRNVKTWGASDRAQFPVTSYWRLTTHGLPDTRMPISHQFSGAGLPPTEPGAIRPACWPASARTGSDVRSSSGGARSSTGCTG